MATELLWENLKRDARNLEVTLDQKISAFGRWNPNIVEDEGLFFASLLLRNCLAETGQTEPAIQGQSSEIENLLEQVRNQYFCTFFRFPAISSD